MTKKYPLLVAVLVVGLAVPAKLAEAVSIGQICQKLGTKSIVQIGKIKAPVICRLVSKKKIWVRAAVRISTTSTTSTSTTVPATDFVDSIESVDLTYHSSLHRMTFSDGVVREYTLVLPANYDPQVSYPLAIGLHGVGAKSSQVRAEMNLENSSTSLIVAYPQGLDLGPGTSTAWNAGTCCSPATILQSNDGKFISRLIESIENQFKVDQSRVWVVGFSNGGMMAYRLACEIPDQITGIAVGAGAVTVGTCAPSRAVNVIHLHGEQDSKVPLIGGGSYGVKSAEDSLAQLANANLCVKIEANPGESLFKWKCPTLEVMELILSPNGHDWGGDWSQRMIDFLQFNPRK